MNTTERDEVRGTIFMKICDSVKGLDADEIQDHYRINEDLGIDSMDKSYLFFYIENEFDISFKDSEIEKCKTVGSIVDLVCTKTGIK
jgi:acyl carrier protein